MCKWHSGSLWEQPWVETCKDFDSKLTKIMAESGNDGDPTEDEETEAFRLAHPLDYAGVTKEDLE